MEVVVQFWKSETELEAEWQTAQPPATDTPSPSLLSLPPSLPVCLTACWTAEEKKSDPVSRYRKGVWSYQTQLDWKLLWKYYKTAELWVWHEKGKAEGIKVDPASKRETFS